MFACIQALHAGRAEIVAARDKKIDVEKKRHEKKLDYLRTKYEDNKKKKEETASKKIENITRKGKRALEQEAASLKKRLDTLNQKKPIQRKHEDQVKFDLRLEEWQAELINLESQIEENTAKQKVAEDAVSSPEDAEKIVEIEKDRDDDLEDLKEQFDSDTKDEHDEHTERLREIEEEANEQLKNLS